MTIDSYTLDFSGVKIALIYGDKVLTILRDDIPDIPYPNMIELPGGGREDMETPFQCVQREVYEELGISISRESITWVKTYPGIVTPDKLSVFMVASITLEMINAISFGDEGQGYQLMLIDDFLMDSSVIPQLQMRLQDYLKSK